MISACKGGSANKITGTDHLPLEDEFYVDLFSCFTVLSIQQTIEEEVSSRRHHRPYAS